MTKTELIKQIAAKFPLLNLRDIDLCVNEIIESLTGTLCEKGRVEIRGFGCFTVRYRQPRNARNPKTGEKLVTLPRYTPHFKAGKELRDRVNGKK
jgi:integration host factor subunit beta